MISITSSILIFLPEITMIMGAIVILMLGVFGYPYFANVMAFAFSLGVLLMIFYTPAQDVNAFNDMMYSNAFSKFGKLIVVFATTIIIAMIYSLKKKFEMPVLVMLSTAGMMFMISANSLLTLYISLELVTLPSYILAAFSRDDYKSSEAGMKYFILGSLASGLFLMGATFIYGFTGYIGFNEIYDYYVNYNGEAESVVIPIGFLVGLIFIIVAFSFKISAAPFHMWTPDVYEGSPTIVTAFFASAPKIAGVLVLVRLLMDPFSELYVQWQQVLIALSIASMFVGSLGAIMQTNFKRLLAYSSIGHVGFILAGLVSAENEGAQGVLIYLVIYLTMTISAFACLMVITKNSKYIEDISDFKGLSRTYPNIALAIAILMLSMAGIPPMAGFFAKFYILIPLIKAEMYSVAITFVVASVIAAYYYLRIIKVIYFDSAEANDIQHSLLPNTPISIKVVIGTGALFNLIYIFMPTPLVRAAEIASLALFN